MSGRTSDWYNSNCYSSLFYNDMEAIKQLVVDASNWFFETYTDEDRRDYDSDEDGFLDCVSLIYAADDFKTAKRNDDNMWAFQHFINDSSLSDLSTPGANCFFWASYDFVFDKDNRQNIDTRTFIHEIGHTFGLRDYYDCGYQYSPGGGYTIMDMAIAGLDPYSVMALGWAEPYIPTESMTLKIGAFQKSREIILLTPNWNEYNSPFDEYLLLELYTPTGLNEYHSSKNDNCKQVGIRVWHIDSRLIYGTDIKGDLVTDASSGVCTLAMSNTYYNENGDGNMYLSELGEEFYNYNLIQCINANSTMEGTYKFADTETRPEYLNTQEKFTSGTSFSFDYPSGDNVYIKELDSKYNNFNCEKQFVNKGKLNSGKELGWSFAVEKIEGEGDDSTAIISLIKK